MQMQGRAHAPHQRCFHTSVQESKNCAVPCARASIKTGHPRLPLRHPINRHIRDHGGVVAGHHLSFPIVRPKLGIKVFSLPPVGYKVVKARAHTVVLLAHVPLPNVGSGISLRLQLPGKGGQSLLDNR